MELRNTHWYGTDISSKCPWLKKSAFFLVFLLLFGGFGGIILLDKMVQQRFFEDNSFVINEIYCLTIFIWLCWYGILLSSIFPPNYQIWISWNYSTWKKTINTNFFIISSQKKLCKYWQFKNNWHMFNLIL